MYFTFSKEVEIVQCSGRALNQEQQQQQQRHPSYEEDDRESSLD